MKNEDYINELLLKSFGKQPLVALWWHTPNEQFAWRTPELVYLTNPKAVIEYVESFSREDGK